MDKFWLVWSQSHGRPTHKHTSEQGARQEAERLARLNPGHRFDVLELIASCKKQDVLWVEVGSHEECPF